MILWAPQSPWMHCLPNRHHFLTSSLFSKMLTLPTPGDNLWLHLSTAPKPLTHVLQKTSLLTLTCWCLSSSPPAEGLPGLLRDFLAGSPTRPRKYPSSYDLVMSCHPPLPQHAGWLPNCAQVLLILQTMLILEGQVQSIPAGASSYSSWVFFILPGFAMNPTTKLLMIGVLRVF